MHKQVHEIETRREKTNKTDKKTSSAGFRHVTIHRTLATQLLLKFPTLKSRCLQPGVCSRLVSITPAFPTCRCERGWDVVGGYAHSFPHVCAADCKEHVCSIKNMIAHLCESVRFSLQGQSFCLFGWLVFVVCLLFVCFVAATGIVAETASDVHSSSLSR